MKTPTLEEVKEYFKNAKLIKCIFDRHLKSEININDIEFKYDEYWAKTIDSEINLWDKQQGYAKILTYKNTEPKFEITKEQVLELYNTGNPQPTIRKMFPEVFETVFKTGYYKHKNGEHPEWFSYVNFETQEYYGRGTLGDWFFGKSERHLEYITSNCELMSTEEATEALKNEALKRYRYKQNLSSFQFGTQDDFYFSYFRIEDGIFKCGDYWLMKDGVWATVIKDVKTIQEAEELLKELGHNFKIV